VVFTGSLNLNVENLLVSIIPPLKVNKEQIFSDNDKANCLNNYFSSVFTNERLDNIPKLESSYPDMPMFTVTVHGVFKLLSKLNRKKNLLVLMSSLLILKETTSDISIVLTFIYNQSLSSGTVPADWRMANISALHKKGPKDLAENYRPISLTSVCCKTLTFVNSLTLTIS